MDIELGEDVDMTGRTVHRRGEVQRAYSSMIFWEMECLLLPRFGSPSVSYSFRFILQCFGYPFLDCAWTILPTHGVCSLGLFGDAALIKSHTVPTHRLDEGGVILPYYRKYIARGVPWHPETVKQQQKRKTNLPRWTCLLSRIQLISISPLPLVPSLDCCFHRRMACAESLKPARSPATMATASSSPSTLPLEQLTLYHAIDPCLSSIIVFYGSDNTINATVSSSRVPVHIFSPAGFYSYPRITVSPAAPVYAAVNCLPREKQGDEASRGLAFSMLKFFTELSDPVKHYLREFAKTGKLNGSIPNMFDAVHAADLTNRLRPVEDDTSASDVIRDLRAA